MQIARAKSVVSEDDTFESPLARSRLVQIGVENIDEIVSSKSEVSNTFGCELFRYVRSGKHANVPTFFLDARGADPYQLVQHRSCRHVTAVAAHEFRKTWLATDFFEAQIQRNSVRTCEIAVGVPALQDAS